MQVVGPSPPPDFSHRCPSSWGMVPSVPAFSSFTSSSCANSSSSSSSSLSGQDGIPILFKHKLACYLSRFSSVNLIQSLACNLYNQGMATTQIYTLISTPLPTTVEELRDHINVLASRASVSSWPTQDSPLENAMFWCSVFNYMNPGTMEIISLLKRSLSGYLYSSLSSLCCQVASTHKYLEFNPENAPKHDLTTMQILMKDAGLCEFLTNCKMFPASRHHENTELISSLKMSKETAEASSAAKSQFLANMSHEIRQPMNGVLGMARLLKQTPLSEEQWEYVKSITQSGETLLNVVNDILDVSKIEKNVLQLEAAPFDVRECVSDILGTFTDIARQKRVNLSSSIHSSVPATIIQDKSRVKQVLFNLLGNAVKFTGELGCVEITATRAKTTGANGAVMLEFCVSDTGCGISDAVKDRLFEPFCHFNASRGGGAGLGLAISHNLVQLMQGRLWAESESNKGSQFYFTITTGVPDGVVLPTLTNLGNLSPQCPLPPPMAPFKKFKILVVDDDEINLRVMSKMLLKLGQDDVRAIESGVEALVCIEEIDYDLVFMDVYMGDLDGMEVTKRIHKNLLVAQRPCPAIIAVSASAFSEDRDKCLNAGMQDFLPKPIKLEEVAKLLQQWGSKST